MPEVDGLDLQSEMAQMPDPLPILFLTGHADTASIVRAMRRGAEDFLEKTASDWFRTAADGQSDPKPDSNCSAELAALCMARVPHLAPAARVT